MRLLFLVALLCVGCKTHSEATSSIKAELDGTAETTRKVDTTEPVALPVRVVTERWSAPEPIVPTPGGGTIVRMPSGVAPLPRAPATFHDAKAPDPADSYLYERTTVDYGPPGEKVTHEEDGAKETVTASIDGHTETEKDRAPSGIFAFLAGWWPYLLGAIPVLLVVFRKKLPFKLPFVGLVLLASAAAAGPHYGFKASAAVTVSTSATRLDSDARHAFVEVCNMDTSKTLYVAFSSTVTTSTGRPVAPGGCIQFFPLAPAASASSTSGQLLWGITTSTTLTAVVTEGYEQ